MPYYIIEALRELDTIEEDLLEESAKTDFRDKFGQETLNNFDKAKQRLINNGYSTDYGQYLKMDPEELNNLILSLYDDKKDAQKKRIIQGKDKEIRGEYNYIGQFGGYKIYEPLDVQASMDLGVNTGWCTTGRYGHYGHPEFTPSIEDAEEHWNDYTKQGIRLFYFLNPKTMYGEYAIALYPNVLELNEVIKNIHIKSANFEIYNAEDKLDYEIIDKLPLNKLPKIIIDYDKIEKISGTPIALDLLSIEEVKKLPIKIRQYDCWWWLRSPGYYSDSIANVNTNGFVFEDGDYVYVGSYAVCPALTISNLKSFNLKLYSAYNLFGYNWIYIGNNKFLYKDKIIRHWFDEESNDYETSDIKQFLNEWLQELKNYKG